MDYTDPMRYQYSEHAGGQNWSGTSNNYHHHQQYPHPQQDADAEDFQSKSVSEIRQKFNSPPAPSRSSRSHGVLHLNAQPGMPSYVPKRPTIFKKKEPQGGCLADPGWIPGQPRQQTTPTTRRYTPAGNYSPPVNRPQRIPEQLSPPPPPRDQHFEAPAWVGSLRHSGGPRHWEMTEAEHIMGGGRAGRRPLPQSAVQHAPMVTAHGGGEPVVAHNPRLQTTRYGATSSGGPVYDQQSAAGVDSDSARVAHLQYNTPMGLYSRQNAQEALQVQTRGKAGEGTIQISGDGQGMTKTFNPAYSNVLSMVAEEDKIRGRTQPVRQHTAVRSQTNPRHQDTSGYGQDHHHQQQQQPWGGGGGMESQFDQMGISDF